MTKEQVDEFLKKLCDKIDLWKVIFEDEDSKDRSTMLKLELSHFSCIENIKNLIYKNYSEGPIEDEIHNGHYWVFGKIIKGEQIYIKINKGHKNKPVIIISFHIAEHEMDFPLK